MGASSATAGRPASPTSSEGASMSAAAARLLASAIAATFVAAMVCAPAPAAESGSGLAGGTNPKPAKGATQKLNPRTDMTGTWNRYPEMGAQPDPQFPAAAPIPSPPLKPELVADFEARRKAVAEAEAKGQ